MERVTNQVSYIKHPRNVYQWSKIWKEGSEKKWFWSEFQDDVNWLADDQIRIEDFPSVREAPETNWF